MQIKDFSYAAVDAHCYCLILSIFDPDTTMKKLPSAASSRQLLVPVQGGFGIGDGVGGIGLGTGYPGFYGLAGLGPWGAGCKILCRTDVLSQR